MELLWPKSWYDIADGEDALRSIARRWKDKGYDQLDGNDYARLEPFLEPFDGIYSDQEVVILSRVGNNGVQKEMCQLFTDPGQPDAWKLEWWLPETDVRRLYLGQVARILYGKEFDYDTTQCMLMLAYAISCLRQLKLTIKGDRIIGTFQDPEAEAAEMVAENSFEDPVLLQEESYEEVTLDSADDDAVE